MAKTTRQKRSGKQSKPSSPAKGAERLPTMSGTPPAQWNASFRFQTYRSPLVWVLVVICGSFTYHGQQAALGLLAGLVLLLIYVQGDKR